MKWFNVLWYPGLVAILGGTLWWARPLGPVGAGAAGLVAVMLALFVSAALGELARPTVAGADVADVADDDQADDDQADDDQADDDQADDDQADDDASYQDLVETHRRARERFANWPR